MTAPEVGTNLPARQSPKWLTKEEAGEPPELHSAWDEPTQRWMGLGQKIAVDRERLEAEPEFQIQQYDARRTALLKFIDSKLQEAVYENGYPVKGAMHDFYRLPDFDLKTVTKPGASKVANLMRFRVGKKRVTEASFTADHGHARVMVELIDQDGRVVGAHEAACSTSEKGFQSAGTRCKYGAKWERNKGEWVKELEPPDYRAAENDVVSRAGKRAFVGALIVAASLEEVFDLERSTDEAGEEGSEKPKAAAKAAPARGTPTMAFGDNKGVALADPRITADELTRVRKWCVKTDEAKWGKFIGEIDEELERRRTAGAQ